MTLSTLLELARFYNNLGWAIQEQFDDIVDDADTIGNKNPNALKYIEEFLKSACGHDDELTSDAEDLLQAIKYDRLDRAK